MGHENLTWGQRRIANELQLKLGLRVSPRTVRKYMPTHLNRTPGRRLPSQRWRTFVRNHAWNLITSGVVADLTRGRQALSARIIQIVQGWWNRSVASWWRRTQYHDAMWLSWRSAPASGLAVWSPVSVEVIRVDQRSPPDGEPSRVRAPGLATQAILGDRWDVCPADAVLCWWCRASLYTRGARPLSTSGSHVVPWRQAA
jgi:hypothetical protein